MRHKVTTDLLYPNLWRGCVGAWAPCLGPSGTTLWDWSGRGNHGTLANMEIDADWIVSGGRGALSIDGTNEYVTCGTRASTPLFSVGGWGLKTTLVGIQTFICMGNASGTIGAFYIRPGNTSGFTSATNVYKTASFPEVSVNTWTHIMMTLDGANLQFYTNGLLTATTAYAFTAQATSQELTIGRLGALNGQYWTGYVDDIRWYDRALNNSEINLLASRRGIAYETVRRRSYKAAAAGFRPAWASQRTQIIGGGSR